MLNGKDEEIQLAVEPADTPAGLYLHIPFCRTKCRYCDFYSLVDPQRIDTYVDALCSEMRLVRAPHLFFDTIYIGGGTPSLLSGEQIERLIATAREAFSLLAGSEITIEVNPESLREARLTGYGAAGVNRISIGVQSFGWDQLKFLGRLHSPAQAKEAVDLARRTGFKNISLDLIYGLPQQTHGLWRLDLETALELNPEHLSCYTLTYESDTPLGRDRAAGRLNPLADQAVADLYRQTVATLSAAGYSQYEVSNFARRPRFQSRHNRKYWQFGPYLGFGAAAHSYKDPVRWWNHADLGRYLQQIETGSLPIADREMLTRDQQIIEAVYLGLRTAAGLSKPDLQTRFEFDFEGRFGELIVELQADRLAALDGDRVHLTLEGMLLLDAITDRFMACC